MYTGIQELNNKCSRCRKYSSNEADGYNYTHPKPGTYNLVISYDDTGGDTVTASVELGVEL